MTKGNNYKVGAEINITTKTLATPGNLKIISSTLISSSQKTYTKVTTTDTPAGGKTTTKPSGTNVGQSGILASPKVEETWS